MNQPAPAPRKPPTGAFVFAGVIIALFIDLPVGRLLGRARGLLRSTGSGRTLDPSLIAAIIGAGGYSFA